ncbi:tetratricopeptide repeat protein [Streptomyces sp. NPDC059697]|uniref:tetratricopeptide repeat protein n=1 Tax=Streptomyces sp. NPDC059697 TaxID=3346912 RepID=UPI0036C2D08D
MSPDEAASAVGVSVEELSAWANVLPKPKITPITDDESTDEFQSGVAESIVTISPMIVAWVCNARLDDIASLNAPGADEIKEALDSPPPEVELFERYRWLVDRFSETFLRDWSTPSLHLEYRWLMGRELPPCEASLMSDRPVGEAELQAEIARRVVFPPRLPALVREVDAGGRLVIEMEGHARTLLGQGRCREAAALFEFAGKRRPDDPTVHNDLGFCLIPVNPEDALSHLQRAADLDYPQVAINVYNRMCCCAALKDWRSVLRLADSYWGKDLVNSPVPATVWRHTSDGNWAITSTLDVRRMLAEFSYEIAQAEGLKDESALWRARVREIGIS